MVVRFQAVMYAHVDREPTDPIIGRAAAALRHGMRCSHLAVAVRRASVPFFATGVGMRALLARIRACVRVQGPVFVAGRRMRVITTLSCRGHRSAAGWHLRGFLGGLCAGGACMRLPSATRSLCLAFTGDLVHFLCIHFPWGILGRGLCTGAGQQACKGHKCDEGLHGWKVESSLCP